MTHPTNITMAGRRLLGYAVDVRCPRHSTPARYSCIPGHPGVCPDRLTALLAADAHTQEADLRAHAYCWSERFNQISREEEWPIPPQELVHPAPSPEDIAWQRRQGHHTEDD